MGRRWPAPFKMTGFPFTAKNGTEKKIRVRFCPFCGNGSDCLRFIAESSAEQEIRSEDWCCDCCGTFFTITGVEKD